MLTDQQRAFFEAFGFLQLKQVFPPDEIALLTAEADRVWADDALKHPNVPHQSISSFIERNPTLMRLATDDRIHGVVSDLLAPDFIYGNSEGNRGSFNEEHLHHWHCDRVGEYDLNYLRVKVMIYLTPTTRETGALRVIPGSHRAPLHQAMIPLNAQMENTSEFVFGLPGAELPGYALESKPGDVVFFNHYLFHAVYGKSADRRYLAIKYADKPEKMEHFASLRRHHQDVSHLDPIARESNDPRMRRMIAPLFEG